MDPPDPSSCPIPTPSPFNTQSSLPQAAAGQVDVGLGQWRGAPALGPPTPTGRALVVAVVALLLRLRPFPLLDLSFGALCMYSGDM